ncbi:MAG: hypothetical protein A2V88_05990 [Elusimicrobia bacterium RBG_16_66_12]|nr:MAG: hypothetical protein A2V88_05990 [Elusimicrobia bacterium RBG_16_66_12]
MSAGKRSPRKATGGRNEKIAREIAAHNRREFGQPGGSPYPAARVPTPFGQMAADGRLLRRFLLALEVNEELSCQILQKNRL